MTIKSDHWLTDLGTVVITTEIRDELRGLTDEEAAERLDDMAWERFGPRGMVRPGRDAVGGSRPVNG